MAEEEELHELETVYVKVEKEAQDIEESTLTPTSIIQNAIYTSAGTIILAGDPEYANHVTTVTLDNHVTSVAGIDVKNELRGVLDCATVIAQEEAVDGHSNDVDAGVSLSTSPDHINGLSNVISTDSQASNSGLLMVIPEIARDGSEEPASEADLPPACVETGGTVSVASEPETVTNISVDALLPNNIVTTVSNCSDPGVAICGPGTFPTIVVTSSANSVSGLSESVSMPQISFVSSSETATGLEGATIVPQLSTDGQTVIRDGILPITELFTQGTGGHEIAFRGTIPSSIAGALPEGTILQIGPDATILTFAGMKDMQEMVTGQCQTAEDSHTAETSPAKGDTVESLSFSNNHQRASEAIVATAVDSAEVVDFSGFLSESDDNQPISLLQKGNETPKDPACGQERSILQPSQEGEDIGMGHAEEQSGAERMVSEQQDAKADGEDDEMDQDVGEPSEKLPSSGSSEGSNVVVIDVSKPIQLSQNSLIVVNGQKCVLQHDPQTGQVVAYPVKEPEKPRRKRGRPRKIPQEQQPLEAESGNMGEEQGESDDSDPTGEKGFVEITTEDGNIVRRSCRKRKQAKSLKDYETGNLKLELGSDEEEKVEVVEEEDLDVLPRKRGRGRGRPRKNHTFSLLPFLQPGKRGRGRPRRYGVAKENMQAFLIQTADGQTLMMQVPVSRIPTSMTLQEVAQGIASSLNSASQPLSGTFTLTTSSIENTISDVSENTADGFHEDDDSTSGQSAMKATSVSDSPAVPDGCTVLATAAEETELLPTTDDTEVCQSVSCSDTVLSVQQSKRTGPCIVTLTPAVPTSTPSDEPLSPTTHGLDGVPSKDTPAEQVSETLLTSSSPTLPETTDTSQVNAEPSDANATKESDSPSTDSVADVIVSSETSAINGPATVIPLPDKLLPLFLPKSDSPVKIGLKANESDLEQFHCPKCDFQAYYLQQYQEHLVTVHSLEVQKCKCCSFLCFEENELFDHYKEHHPKCICPVCNHTAEYSYIIKRHMYRHSETGRTCEICGTTYKDHYILKMHIKMVHLPAEVLFECSSCGKKFNRKAHLKRHLRTHEPDKPYKCDMCDYRGCERSDITKHMLIHEEPKHVCEVCGKTFRHVKNRDLHLKRHRGQRDYKCGVCEFFGYTFTDIRKHIERKHSDSQTIICNRCGQAFKSESLLKEHQESDQCVVYMALAGAETAYIQVPGPDEAETSHVDTEAEEASTDDAIPAESPAVTGVATMTLDDGSIATLNTLAELEDGQIIVSGVDGQSIVTPGGQLAIMTDEDGVDSQVTLLAIDHRGMATTDGTGDQVMQNVMVTTAGDGELSSDRQVTMVTADGLMLGSVILREPEMAIDAEEVLGPS